MRHLLLLCLMTVVTAAERDLPCEVTLDLTAALPRTADDADPPNLQVYLGCHPDGRWDPDVQAWAGNRRDRDGTWIHHGLLNNMDHDGTVAAVERPDGSVTLDLTLAINDDPWVKGGAASYRVDLRRTGNRFTGTFSGTFRAIPASGAASARMDERPWPAAVAGVMPAAPGEHPRVVFRAADLPRLKARAATPEGRAILERLRAQLGGGETLPAARNTATWAYGASEPVPLGGYTLAHGMGYGLLWQLTGEKRYADLARQAVDLARAGVRDRDQRYALHRPGGKLRAGYAYWSIAAAYDLCYDAWPEDYRRTIALEIQEKIASTGAVDFGAAAREAGVDAADITAKVVGTEDEKAKLEPVQFDLLFKTTGGQHSPMSNHYGAWNGGGGAALLAIMGDPGTDAVLCARAHRIFLQRAKRCLQAGFGDAAWFFEGGYCGRLSLNTGFWFYLNALRSSQGLDLVEGSDEATWLLAKHLYEVTRGGGTLQMPERGMYAHQDLPRDGQSSGGDYAHGLPNVPTRLRPAVLWFYNHVIVPGPEKDYDALLWPHRAVDAFVHWPIGEAECNPGEVVPRWLHDRKANYLVLRSGWTGTDQDVGLSIQDGGAIVTGLGGWRTTAHVTPLRRGVPVTADDGKACIIRAGDQALIGDCSGLAGAPILWVVIAGLPNAEATAVADPAAPSADPFAARMKGRFAGGGQQRPAAAPIPSRLTAPADAGPQPVPEGEASLSQQRRSVDGRTCTIWSVQRGPAPSAVASADGDTLRLTIGRRVITVADGQVTLASAP